MKYIIAILLAFTFLITSMAIADNKIILAGSNWEPYMGDTLPGKGFFAEISTEALKSVGYDVEIKIVPCARAIMMTKSADYTAIMGASFTKERSEYFAYPKYSWEVQMSFFSLKGKSIMYKNLEDLCPVKVGLIRGSYLLERLKAVTCINLDLGNSVSININKLIAGRFDLYLESKDNVNYHLDKLSTGKIDSIESISPPFETDRIYTTFSKSINGYKKLVADFDKGIKLIKENGIYDRILKKHGIIEINPIN